LSEKSRACCTCKTVLPRTAEYFNRQASNPDGMRYDCKACSRKRNASHAARNKDPAADKQKKQEYNVLMGKTADFLRDPEQFTEPEIRELARRLYHAHLAEDEQRYMNRRAARAISLHLARQALDRREWKAAMH
jgi:hypothetical protein